MLPKKLQPSVSPHEKFQASDTEYRLKQTGNYDYRHRVTLESRSTAGSRVYVPERDSEGKIVSESHDPRSFLIQMDDGSILRRNSFSLHELPSPQV